MTCSLDTLYVECSQTSEKEREREREREREGEGGRELSTRRAGRGDRPMQGQTVASNFRCCCYTKEHTRRHITHTHTYLRVGRRARHTYRRLANAITVTTSRSYSFSSYSVCLSLSLSLQAFPGLLSSFTINNLKKKLTIKPSRKFRYSASAYK